MTSGWRILAVVALLTMTSASPSVAAPPPGLLQVYVNYGCTAAHCESEHVEYVCTAAFAIVTSPLEVPVSSSVSCYAPDNGVEVAPGVGAIPGPVAAGVGAATVPWNGSICVEGAATYLAGGALHTVTAGPICRGTHEWPSVQDLVVP